MDKKEPMMDEELSNLITLTDEEGNDVEFEFLDLVEYQGGEYVVLLPVDGEADEAADEVVILRVEENPDDPEQENYVGVEDDATLEAVFEVFQERFKDEFEFTE